MAGLFLEMSQWKKFMSASAWVQVLDFTKSFVYSNCQNDRKYCFVLFCLCAIYAFSHLYVCLSFPVNDCRSDVSPVNISFPIISGEFDALHQLSVKKKRSFGNTASRT